MEKQAASACRNPEVTRKRVGIDPLGGGRVWRGTGLKSRPTRVQIPPPALSQTEASCTQATTTTRMPKDEVHVTPAKDGWDVKRSGAKRASSTHDTKKEAIDAGRELAKKDKTSMRIHKEDGTIQEERSYGNDRRDRPG